MVSKRFILKNDVNGEEWVYDNGTYIDNRMMVELLNDLNEENEVLRKRIIDLEVEIYQLKEELLMRMDYDYIIKENGEMEMQISELKKEIRQLKEDNEYWIQRADLTEEEQQEVIEYLHAYHQGDVENIKE